MDAIKKSVAEMSEMFLQKLGEFEKRQQELQNSATPGVSTLEADFVSFKEFVLCSLRALQKQVEIIARVTDNLEMHNRRKILLMHGIPEGKQEDTATIIAKTLSEQLKIDNFEVSDISRSHRMGRLTTASGKHRPILFELRDVNLRANIWAAKTNLKGSGITISEFLTKPRHDAFMEARKRYGITKCWTRGGYIYILDPAGGRHRISTIVELDNLGVPVQPTQTPATAAPKATVSNPKEPTQARSRRTGNIKK